MKISIENRLVLLRSSAALGVITLMLALPAVANAQAAPTGDDQAGSAGQQTSGGVTNDSSGARAAEDIVVTGTILHGAAPVGSNLIIVGQERIAASGAATANELMATVPQVSNLFNNVPTARLGVAVNQLQVVRPNLRNLAQETSSSASTLVLFDGHRISPVGVSQNAIDPDIIPPIAIERVEVVTDGGSATYGSDAVGGVINFITRKRFDGVKVAAHYGFADEYYQVDAGGIVGKDWGTGSIFAAYSYQHNDALFGRDRAFIRNVDWLSPNLTPRGRSCAPGNVQNAGAFSFVTFTFGPSVNYALPNLATRGVNACDETFDTTVVPSSTRHSALVSLHQDLSTWLTVDLRSFYGQRSSTSQGPFRGSATVTGGSSATSPRQFYYMPTASSPNGNETVYFSLAPLLGQNSLRSGTQFKEWGANAEFKARITNNWQLRTLFNYSESDSEYHIGGLNNTLLSAFGKGTTAATAINFYSPSAADLPQIRQLIDTETAAQGRESLLNGRAILDGTLFTLPGGGVKLAVGYEYMHDGFQQRVVAADMPIGTLRSTAYTSYSRDINSLFGEVQVPIVGDDNRMGMIYSLTLAGSIRYDHFSDFGSTHNPKVGFTLKPVQWLGFRGNYSTSFNAPSPVDQLGSLKNNFFFGGFFPQNAFIKPGDSPTVAGLLAIQGSNPGLMPQTAKSYSFGIDVDPPFIRGLHLSANYYNVKFKNIIRQPSFDSSIFANFPSAVISNPNGVSLAQLQSFVNNSGVPNSAAVLATTAANRCNQATGTCQIYELIDFRYGNYGIVNVEGLDFTANYRTKTGFGGLDAGISGNYILGRTSQTGVGAPIINDLKPGFKVLPGGTIISTNGSSRLQFSATVGADVGNFRAQATLNHSSGWGLTRCDTTTTSTLVCNPVALTTGNVTAAGLPQDRVSDFNTVNLFFKYDVPGGSPLLKDLSLTLNVNNVFAQDPPIYRSVGSQGYTNGFTLGRLIQFGVSKKF